LAARLLESEEEMVRLFGSKVWNLSFLLILIISSQICDHTFSSISYNGIKTDLMKCQLTFWQHAHFSIIHLYVMEIEYFMITRAHIISALGREISTVTEQLSSLDFPSRVLLCIRIFTQIFTTRLVIAITMSVCQLCQ
jgi:hypothetical protein